jgi:hypothetical protein
MVAEQRSSQTAKRPSGGRAFVIQIPLTGLAAGPYLLQLEGRSKRDPAVTVTRRIPISIQ